MSKTLIFVSSHRRHNKVASRLLGAVAAHRKTELLSFERGEVDHPVYSDPSVSHTTLGPIANGIAVSRVFSVMRAFWVLRRARRRLMQSDGDTLFLVNTLELLVICWLCGLTRLPTVYDVSDIHPLQSSRSFLGRATRRIERMALKRVKLVVVTSPWFYWEYYECWIGAPLSAVLIENKVDRDTLDYESRPVLSNTIAWNGLLRCQLSARVLLECLKAFPALHLSLHGSLDDLGSLGPKLLELPNCSYTGPYAPEALSALLAPSSFVWAVDFSVGENSKWLLPNRLYEALAAGVPLIAVNGTATAEAVRHYGIGMVLPECTPGAVIDAFASCNPETYQRWLTNMRALKDRAVRGDEWALVLDDEGRWDQLRRLPNKVDVSVVLAPDPADWATEAKTAELK